MYCFNSPISRKFKIPEGVLETFLNFVLSSRGTALMEIPATRQKGITKRYKIFVEFFERKLKRYEKGFDVDGILKEEDEVERIG